MFLSLVDLENDTPRDASLAASLKLVSIILPYEADDKESEADKEAENNLAKAVLLKKKIAEQLWLEKKNQELLLEGELAEQFSNALFRNLIGHQPELLKPKEKSTLARNFREIENPALIHAYKLLTTVYLDVPADSSLFARLYGHKFLFSLTQLLHSRDALERKTVSGLFKEIIAFRIGQVEKLSESGMRDLQSFVRNMISIMQTILSDFNAHVTDITVRPLASLFDVLQSSIQVSLSTEFEDKFRQVLIRGVLPLFDSPRYEKIGMEFNDLLEFQLKGAKESFGVKQQDKYWQDISSGLIRHTFRRSSLDSNDNDLARFEFLLQIYSEGSVHPSVHGKLLKKFAYRARKSDQEEVKIHFLLTLLEPQFTRIFKTDFMYEREEVRIIMLRKVLRPLLHWYLEETTMNDLWKLLLELIATLPTQLTYYVLVGVCPQFAELARRVKGKLFAELEKLDTSPSSSSDEDSSSSSSSSSLDSDDSDESE
jgi:hypothetical protein